jgi:hypothetical protein
MTSRPRLGPSFICRGLLSAGVDKGKGGKYLILPPGFKDTPPDGYIILPSQTYQGFALLRSIVRRQQRRHRRGRRLRQTDQALSAVAVCEPPADRFGRRDQIPEISAGQADPNAKIGIAYCCLVKVEILIALKPTSIRFNDQGVIADCQRDAVDVV